MACVFLTLALGACSESQDDFTSGLSLNPCDSSFPACNTSVGCILDNSSYTSGTFPGGGQFLVRIDTPSTVEIDFYLINPTSSGTQTQITWNESGCTSTFQDCVVGKDFTEEAEASNGVFSAVEMLSSPGDHLIQFNSDATAGYLVKAVITSVVGNPPVTLTMASQCQ